MENQNENTAGSDKKYSEKEFTNMMVDCIDVECLQLYIEEQNVQKETCESSKEKYFFFHYSSIALAILMLITIFPVIFFHWIIFAISVVMINHTLNKRTFWKTEYEMDFSIFNTCEFLIKEAKFNLYGIK